MHVPFPTDAVVAKLSNVHTVALGFNSWGLHSSNPGDAAQAGGGTTCCSPEPFLFAAEDEYYLYQYFFRFPV